MTYNANNWSNFNNSLKRHSPLSLWFDDGTDWEAKSFGGGDNKRMAMRRYKPVLMSKMLFGVGSVTVIVPAICKKATAQLKLGMVMPLSYLARTPSFGSPTRPVLAHETKQ